jgi:hypothetical protein
MSPRTLEAIERVLMAALAVILALGVWNAFLRVIQTSETGEVQTTADPSAATTTVPTTTRAPIVVRSTTTTSAVPTTTSDRAFPFTNGSCRQTQPPTSGSVTLLRVYFNCGNIIEPSGTTFVYRTVPRTLQRLTETLKELVQGPTEDEKALGFGSFFSADTADAFRSVTIKDGRAFIDFNAITLPEVVKSEQGRRFFVINIAANALQFESVTSVEIRLEGSCEAFSELVGTTGCTVITQADL